MVRWKEAPLKGYYDGPVGPWRRSFALLPVTIDDEWVWLEWYWFRSGCGGWWLERKRTIWSEQADDDL